MASAVIAELPALPLHEAGKYVAAAYVVVFVLVLLYVAIMAVRLSRIERRLAQLSAVEGPSGNDADAAGEGAGARGGER